jgi:hypothetical protein
MDARDALGPLEFQFQDEADQAKYGDRWFRYAETDLIRLPARKLIELEARMGMRLVDVMNGMRESTVLGDTAAAWIGVRLVDPELAGPFDEFDPISLMIKWEKASGKADAVETTQVTPQPPAKPSEELLLPAAPTVVLQTSPIAE